MTTGWVFVRRLWWRWLLIVAVIEAVTFTGIGTVASLTLGAIGGCGAVLWARYPRRRAWWRAGDR